MGNQKFITVESVEELGKGFLTVDFTKEEYELLVWDATHFYALPTVN